MCLLQTLWQKWYYFNLFATHVIKIPLFSYSGFCVTSGNGFLFLFFLVSVFVYFSLKKMFVLFVFCFRLEIRNVLIVMQLNYKENCFPNKIWCLIDLNIDLFIAGHKVLDCVLRTDSRGVAVVRNVYPFHLSWFCRWFRILSPGTEPYFRYFCHFFALIWRLFKS